MNLTEKIKYVCDGCENNDICGTMYNPCRCDAIMNKIAVMNGVERINKMENLKQDLTLLKDEERHKLFSEYCHGCGSTDKGCQCWNDE